MATTELTKIESTKLAQCERTIREGMRTFYEVGSALRTIRDEKLYRAEHETFEAYCAEVHQWGKSRAYQLIAASEVAEVAREMSTKVDKGDPSSHLLNEAAARPIAALPEEKRKEAIREAQRLAEEDNDENPIVTSKHTKAAAAKVSGAKPHKRPAKAEKPAEKSPPAGPSPDSLEGVQGDLEGLAKEIRGLSRKAREVLAVEGQDVTRPFCGRYSFASICGDLNTVAAYIERNMPTGGTAKKPTTKHDDLKAREAA